MAKFTRRSAAIEGGGTSWLVAISEDEVDNLVELKQFPTDANPEVTLSAIRKWLNEKGPFDSIGIASFGPCDVKLSSPTYGYITSTPKPGWKNTDVIGLLGLRDEFAGVPFLFDTDVNAPALAEYNLHRTSESTSSGAYITVGTGVGVGLVVNGKSVKGLLHPEAGHIHVMLKPGDTHQGTCPFHGSCIEGMCNTISLASRKGISAADLPSLPDDDDVWDYLAYYLGQLCANLVLIAMPEFISIGGGVLNRMSLYPKIRAHTAAILNGYVQDDHITTSAIETFIRPSYW